MRQLLLALLLALALAAADGRRLLQDDDEATAEGKGDYCVTGDFPLEFKEPVDFNVNEGIGFFKDDSTNLECHCEDHKCGCTGTGEDCDEYSQGWFLLLAYAHQFGAFLYDFPKYNEKYHLESMVVWGIIGLVLGWLGALTILYMEIKAVSLTRERDERNKLVSIRAMERANRMVELEKTEDRIMAPRPYVTICGSVLLFVGLFCQLIPFCHLLSEMGLPVAFHGFCALFVMTSSFMMTACAVLAILGIVWSCTRGWAALVLLVLALLGELMLFGGFVSCLIWTVLAVAVLFLYFVFLPSQYKEKGEPIPGWVQDLGAFEVQTDLDAISDAFAKGGQIFVEDLTTNPVAAAVGDAATNAKTQIDKLTGTPAAAAEGEGERS